MQTKASLTAVIALMAFACAPTLKEPYATRSSRPLGGPEGTLLEWLTAYNRNDRAAFESFAARRYSTQELAERSPAAIANGARHWHRSFGPMHVVGDPIVKPGEAEAIVYAAGIDVCARLFVEADPVEKDKIGGVYLSPYAAVECGEQRARVNTLGEFTRETRGYLDRLVKAERFSGTLLVTKGARALVSEARGLARARPPLLNTVDTRFELASISKAFTAVAIARLVEQGRLAYGSKVGDVLPAFTGDTVKRQITVRQLLSHTAGLSDYYRNGTIFTDYKTREQLADYWPLFSNHPLEHEPGTTFSYSNSNYLLLGSIVENVSSMPFSAFVQREVFDRAGMVSSCYCDPMMREFAQPRSTYTALAGPGRRAVPEGLLEVPYEWPRPAPSAGFSVSTAHDLTRFGRSLLDGQLVTAGTLGEMRKPAVVMNDGGTMGLGVMTHQVRGLEIFGHGGSSWGVRTELDIYPSLDIIVVILTNSDTTGAEALQYKIRKWLSSLGSIR